MKTFSQFVKESTKDTEKMDAQELNRQKQHLKNKADEYAQQAAREQHFGQGGAAAAKGKTFSDAAKNIK